MRTPQGGPRCESGVQNGWLGSWFEEPRKASLFLAVAQQKASDSAPEPMAFVPRVHNRQVPTANQAVFVRSSLEEQRKHRLAVERMRPAIDNKWGQMHNGVRETKRATYPHVKINLKRAQLEDERAQAIEMENFHLLEKLSKILERPLNPTRGKTREWGGGVRLDAHQVPVIDHQVPAKTTAFGAAVEATSLNIGMRERQQNEIVVANHKLVKRMYARTRSARDSPLCPAPFRFSVARQSVPASLAWPHHALPCACARALSPLQTNVQTHLRPPEADGSREGARALAVEPGHRQPPARLERAAAADLGRRPPPPRLRRRRAHRASRHARARRPDALGRVGLGSASGRQAGASVDGAAREAEARAIGDGPARAGGRIRAQGA